MRKYYEANKQKILIIFIVVTSVFFLFYWTFIFFNSKKEGYLASSDQLYTQVGKALGLKLTLEQSNNTVNEVKIGLLGFSQELANKKGVSTKLVTLRPIKSDQDFEHVNIRLESMYYTEVINVIAEFERYNNLWIKAVTLTPRYDDTKLVDINMEVVKF